MNNRDSWLVTRGSSKAEKYCVHTAHNGAHGKIRVTSRESRIANHESRVTAFTLIELVVALTIFSVIGVAIYGSLATGTNIWRRTLGHQSTYQGSGLLADILQDDLACAVDIVDVPFKGTQNSLEFIVLKNSFDAETKHFKKEFKHVRYHVERESRGEVFYRFETGFPHKSGINTKGTRVMSRLGDTVFRYYGYDWDPGAVENWEEGPAWEWKEEWNSPGKLPRAVWFKTTMEPDNDKSSKAILDRKFRIPSGTGEYLEQET